jgi:4-alpha-glucanotransferase
MTDIRSAGILLHITSLPSRFGIGDMGPAAFEFVDFLQAAGQSVWQILPLCPTTKGNSPYSSYSAFAGNKLLISAEALLDQGWLQAQTLDQILGQHSNLESSPNKVDFESVTRFKTDLLKAAFVESAGALRDNETFRQFCDEQAWWLNDFALFEAIRELTGEEDWTKWPTDYRILSTAANLAASSESSNGLVKEIEFSKFKQFLFESQWLELKNYANQQGISICGDMPIFVAHESADVWANQQQFLLDANGNRTSVAGVPPDYFSETGQLWGNPLYDWPAMEADGFAWWCSRFRRALDQFDLLRVDHFRGFDRYWKIPADAETAAEGVWESGPGEKPFRAAEEQLGRLPIWAEDLGDIDQSVHDLRDRLGFPTMRVMQFGYSDAHDDFHRHTTFQQNCIAYTGTHDNDTLMSWFSLRRESNDENEADVLTDFLNSENTDPIHFQLIELLYQSNANVAIVPLQDVLGLGSEARMNVPGQADGNWHWRVIEHAATAEIAKQLRIMTVVSNRLITSICQSSNT